MCAKGYKPPTQSEQAIGRNEIGPRAQVEEDPASHLSKTSTYQDELDAIGAQTLNFVDLNEIEQRIGLLSRIILEHNLRKGALSAKDKCDIALRAITVLEGSKQEVTWRDEMLRKPKKATFEAYKKEREAKEKKLKSLLLRKKEVKVSQAEDALKELEKKAPTKPEDVN